MKRINRKPALWIKLTCWICGILIAYSLVCTYFWYRAEERERMKDPWYAQWTAEQEEKNSWKNNWEVNLVCILFLYAVIDTGFGYAFSKGFLNIILYFYVKHKIKMDKMLEQEYYEKYIENKRKWDDFYAGYEARRAKMDAREQEEKLRKERRCLAINSADLTYDFDNESRKSDNERFSKGE